MKILITGDSWASGEWNRNDKGEYNSVPVMNKLLEQDGHEVIVSGNPGGSDIVSINTATKYSNEVDVIIFYKTPAQRSIRDTSHPDVVKMIKQLFKNGDYDFDIAITKLDNATYRSLEELNSRVFLIGGLDKIKQKVDVEYVLPSLIEELIGTEIPSHFKEWDVDKVLKEYPNYFFPDGMHPNRKAIKHTYNLIKDKI